LFKFKTPSGIIGNVFSYEHKGKQYIGVFSGIGGWAGIGMAAGLGQRLGAGAGDGDHEPMLLEVAGGEAGQPLVVLHQQDLDGSFLGCRARHLLHTPRSVPSGVCLRRGS